MKEFILIFVSVYVLLNVAIRFSKNLKLNFLNVLILWGKIFFVSFLFTLPLYIILNFHLGFERLLYGCVKFCTALFITSFLSIPIAILLDRFNTSTN